MKLTSLVRAARLGRVLRISAMVLAAASVAKADTTLRITMQTPLKSNFGQNLLVFQKELEKTSDIDVEIYDSAQLFRDKEVPEAIGRGAVEMGIASLTTYGGQIPAVDVFYMPFLFETEEKQATAVSPGGAVRQLLDDAILETGSRVLWWQTNGPVVLLSNDAPIVRPSDIVGKKVRVFGKTLGTWIAQVGGVPTVISGSEQFLAYQRGTVDVGMTGIGSIRSRSLWEVMDHVTLTNHANVEFVVVINEAFWQSLTNEQREKISAAARVAENEMRRAASALHRDILADAESHSMSVYQPTEDDLAAWREASNPVISDWASRLGDLGGKVLAAAQALK
ncbi:C4-dicarboxylate ABC transporter substrate-binding protein [Notoacmeibacter marinus]|uniref:C4-dicarboxylate ABC transporter substrate-binding protein n=1 Tax=Notoacmeibacter marinus TaxID=1876515 RepID=A0A231V1V3_9HYPH|nr:TRAP transporter substrate-binding protein DctP [Notoacmeibacter marinus]OXT02162.1 C4-dicarboxylate ABC transporter substrate-binding protein [Notoacmeibacter marinus]